MTRVIQQGMAGFAEWLLSFPVDQLKYLFLLTLSLFLGYVFRVFLSYQTTPLHVRWIYHLVLGFSFCLFCFNVWDTLLVVLFVGVAYVLLHTLSLKHVVWAMMVYALSFTIFVHFLCMKRSYGSWDLSVTGPIMMIAQRITYIACELFDGLGRPDGELSEDQRRLKITERPSILQFFSYTFSFVGILAGPACSYKDFANYISGSNMKRLDNPNRYARAKEHNHDPSPALPVILKATRSILCLVLYLATSSIVSKDSLLNETGLRKVILTFVLMHHIRLMYYFTFIICEASCNISGLGFTGYDDKGEAQWDMVQGMSVLSVEFPVNLREMIASWNMMTVQWLRRCVFERSQLNPALMTFIVSSLWHGVYPGYHITFFIFYCGKTAATKVRKNFRHYFQGSPSLKVFYDILTTVSTCIMRDVTVIPFVYLTTEEFVKGWSNVFFIPILICFLLLLLPNKSRGINSKSHKE